MKSAEGSFSAVCDMAFRVKHRCKLVLCSPRISTEMGIDIPKRRCLSWIEQAEQEMEAEASGPA